MGSLFGIEIGGGGGALNHLTPGVKEVWTPHPHPSLANPKIAEKILPALCTGKYNKMHFPHFSAYCTFFEGRCTFLPKKYNIFFKVDLPLDNLTTQCEGQRMVVFAFPFESLKKVGKLEKLGAQIHPHKWLPANPTKGPHREWGGGGRPYSLLNLSVEDICFSI